MEQVKPVPKVEYECVETQEAERQVERAFDVLFGVLLGSKQ